MSMTPRIRDFADWQDKQGVSKPEDRPGREAIAAAVIAQGTLAEISILYANVSTVPYYMAGSNLRSLTISHCNLNALPVEWKEFPNLVYLDLSHNNISQWPVLRLPAVKTLNLSHNQLADELYTLAPSPKGMLTLSSNTLTFADLGQVVARFLGDFKKTMGNSPRFYPELTTLDVRGNRFLTAQPSMAAPKLETYLADHATGPQQRVTSPTDLMILQLCLPLPSHHKL